MKTQWMEGMATWVMKNSTTGSLIMKCAEVLAYSTLNIDFQFQNQAFGPPLHRDIYENVRQISLSLMVPEI